MPNATDPKDFSTRAIHAAYDHNAHQGALNPPVFWSSTFAFESVAQGAARFAGTEPGMIYTRVTNPTVQTLEERLAELEGAEAGLDFGSGMGAITSLIWTLLRPGDELLVDLTLYGCTHSLVNHLLPQFGIETRSADFTKPEELSQHLNERTRLVLFETPANPNMRLVDIGLHERKHQADGFIAAHVVFGLGLISVCVATVATVCNRFALLPESARLSPGDPAPGLAFSLATGRVLIAIPVLAALTAWTVAILMLLGASDQGRFVAGHVLATVVSAG